MALFRKEKINNKETFEPQTETADFSLPEKRKEIEKPQKEAQPVSYKKISADNDTEIQKQADKLREIKFAGRQLEHLLNLAKEKGSGYAIKVAKKTGNACLLDLLHDTLIEKGII